MSIVQERTKEVNSLISQVKEHCMCSKFKDEGGRFMLYFPAGDFAVGGIRVSYHDMGKANALRVVLEKMEKYWVESYP